MDRTISTDATPIAVAASGRATTNGDLLARSPVGTATRPRGVDAAIESVGAAVDE
jgi:hypothetical protein